MIRILGTLARKERLAVSGTRRSIGLSHVGKPRPCEAILQDLPEPTPPSTHSAPLRLYTPHPQ